MRRTSPRHGARLRRESVGRAAIVTFQWTLLGAAGYVAASNIYVLAVEAVTISDVAAAVMYLVASAISLLYLGLQNATTRLRTRARNTKQGELVDTLQDLASQTMKILVLIWMVASGLSITFTAARQVLCAMRPAEVTASTVPLDQGSICIVHRVTILTGLVAMVASGVLFICSNVVDEPHRCHLLGVVPDHKLLPLFLSNKHSPIKRDFSEGSFKCRSSTSITSHAITHPEWNDSTTGLIPSAPAIPPVPPGLGIYPARGSPPSSLLLPRPSLSSIRTHASLHTPPAPPSHPLPPLPAHVALHHPPRSIDRALHPPRRHHPIRPARSDDHLRVPGPPPALPAANLGALHRAKSTDSLSSIYSRSVSGESQPLPRVTPRPSLTTPLRTSSSGSTVTMKRSPLRMTSVVENPESPDMVRRSRTFSGGERGGRADEVRPLEIRKSSRDSGYRNVDARLRGYVESQSQIRQTAVRC